MHLYRLRHTSHQLKDNVDVLELFTSYPYKYEHMKSARM